MAIFECVDGSICVIGIEWDVSLINPKLLVRDRIVQNGRSATFFWKKIYIILYGTQQKNEAFVQ